MRTTEPDTENGRRRGPRGRRSDARTAWVMAENEGRGRGRGPGSPGGRRHSGRGHGRPGDFGPLGPGGFGPPRHRGGGRRGGRGGRGDVRAAILLLLAEEPMHGYQLIQQITDRSDGVWTPSPGSVYPALSQLEDEGLVAFERLDGRKTATLTDEGTAYVESNRAELGSPWDDVGGGVSTEWRELRTELGALAGAAQQVAQVGTRPQVAQAAQTMSEARKALYRILAEDQPAS
jgi:DNA-binding PadR family transcriptional regulator